MYDWDVYKDGNATLTLASGVKSFILQTIRVQMPHLERYFSFVGKGSETKIHIVNRDWFILWMKELVLPVDRAGSFQDCKSLLEEILNVVELREYEYPELESLLSEAYISFSSFVYIGKLNDGKASLARISEFIVAWLNSKVVPQALSLNESAVRQAVGPGPSYNLRELDRGLCILECEQSLIQGTGFYLKDVGMVTCQHVLGEQTKAFVADRFGDRYEIRLKRQNADIDLAIFERPEGLNLAQYEIGPSDSLKQMDHILIVGFANYRIGDSPQVIPGIVTGFRTVSGIRRILTNGPIIAGSSGGPVFDSRCKVVGVAVTGGENMNAARLTEDHGIIPIDAIKYLM